jgi:DNA-binding LacI/PurR family transcriptional regulator
VPVGPWNVDGLIFIPDDLSDAQSEYIQDLIRSGFPVILTIAEKPGPLVAPDNAGGIRQARELLETSDLSIMQVALEAGFLESAHFTRTFHHKVGMTPRAYRDSKRG